MEVMYKTDVALLVINALEELQCMKFRIIGGLLSPGDLVVLVTPIDKEAPKGRLILLQQQTIRDILESDGVAVVTKEHELKLTLDSLGRKPRMVVADYQVFLKEAADTPPDVPLTSFSILFARHKGNLEDLARGARAIDRLRDGNKVLIAEPCTHHTQPDDIGSVKLPRWISQATCRSADCQLWSSHCPCPGDTGTGDRPISGARLAWEAESAAARTLTVEK